MAMRPIFHACLLVLGTALWVVAPATQAQQGLRIGSDSRPRSPFSVPPPAWPSGRWGLLPAQSPDNAIGLARPSSPLRVEVEPKLTSQLLRRFFPGVQEWIGTGWGLQLGLQADRYDLSPRLNLFVLHREFGVQRISYSFSSGYRGTSAPLVSGPAAAPAHRLQWSYALGERGSFGLSYASAGAMEDPKRFSVPTYRLYGEYETRNLTLHGRYGFADGWAISAEATAYDAGNPRGNLGLRLGVRHGF